MFHTFSSCVVHVCCTYVIFPHIFSFISMSLLNMVHMFLFFPCDFFFTVYLFYFKFFTLCMFLCFTCERAQDSFIFTCDFALLFFHVHFSHTVRMSIFHVIFFSWFIYIFSHVHFVQMMSHALTWIHMCNLRASHLITYYSHNHLEKYMIACKMWFFHKSGNKKILRFTCLKYVLSNNRITFISISKDAINNILLSKINCSWCSSILLQDSKNAMLLRALLIYLSCSMTNAGCSTASRLHGLARYGSQLSTFPPPYLTSHQPLFISHGCKGYKM